MCEGTPPVRACEPKLSDVFARVQISDLYRAQAFIYVSAKVQTAEGGPTARTQCGAQRLAGSVEAM